MSARKSSHRTIFLIVSSGSPLALIASSLRSTSKNPVCPMARSLHPPMAHCGQRVRFVATWREEFFKVPISQNPSDVGSLPSRPLMFASNWLSSEVGIQTDGTNLSSPESEGKFGGYRVQSFLTGLTPVPLSQGSIYVIKQSNPTYQALIYPMPTSHPCVNRLVLAADNTAGSWPAPTYALGRYQLDNNGIPMRDKPLMTYLIVNICLDLGTSAVINQESILRPNAMIILALHWPCEGSECTSDGIGHQH